MVTGVNGAKSTQQTGSAQNTKTSETSKDLEGLKTLLALVFTFAAASNHNGSLYAASRYASSAGQALLLMNNENHISGLHKLAENLIDSISESREDHKKEPVSLHDRHSEIKDLRREASGKEAILKAEIEEVAPELGFTVSDTKEKSGKKAGKKARSKEYSKALEKLKAEKNSLRLKLQKSQLDGDEKAEKETQKELELFKIKERIFQSIPEDQRSKKGTLEKVEKTFDGIKEQLGIITDSNTESVKKSFFGLRKTVDVKRTESKARARKNAQKAISELRTELGLNSDRTLSTMISQLN
jgi:hypothetical protein